MSFLFVLLDVEIDFFSGGRFMGQNNHVLIRGQQGDYLRELLKESGILNMNQFIGDAIMDYKTDLISNEVIE